MGATELTFCLVILAISACVQAVFGLGFAMIATPALALLLDHRSAVMLAAAPMLALTATWLWRQRTSLREQSLPWPVLPGIMLGAIVGARAQLALSERTALYLLSALLLICVVLPALLQRSQRDFSVAARRRAPLFGLLAGLTEAALNVGAPFLVLFAGLARLTRKQQLFALYLCFGMGKTIQISVILAHGGLPFPLNVSIMVSAIIGCLLIHELADRWAGRWPEASFRRAFNLFLLLMSAMLVIRATCLP
ncbi:MAG: TSUP family transporter [Advenella sp.]